MKILLEVQFLWCPSLKFPHFSKAIHWASSGQWAICLTPLHYVNKSTGFPTHHTYRKLLSHGNHATKLSAHSFCADVIVSGGLKPCSYWQKRVLVIFTHSATPLCNFAWSATSWLSCYLSQMLPLCSNTTNSWSWNNKEGKTFIVPHANSVRSLERPILSQMYTAWLILCTCDKCSPSLLSIQCNFTYLIISILFVFISTINICWWDWFTL